MLKDIIEATRLSPEFCASLLRVPVEHFREWLDGKRPIPTFVLPELTALLGVGEKELRSRRNTGDDSSSNVAPAIWFKLRDARLEDSDRELVGVIRRLGFSLSQLDEIRGLNSAAAWRASATTILSQIDRSSPPAHQGSVAAVLFRSVANLDKGKTGIGEDIRSRLRQLGVVVIESPLPKASELEGCCFEISRNTETRPCVFSNTFKTTWFRRNEILMHEACHAIFELENDPVSLDFRSSSEAETSVAEARAQAFMTECLTPRSVLVHYANQLGINWENMSVDQLAALIANIHVERRTILRAAFENRLISEAARERYTAYNCAPIVKELSPHAWSTREFLRKQANESPKWVAQNRKTTIGTRRLRLPVGYVHHVIEAVNAGEITSGKAAEMLMMDAFTFSDRFGELVHEPAFA